MQYTRNLRARARLSELQAPFRITMSGLAAAAHRQGPGAVRAYLNDLAAHNWDSAAAIRTLEAPGTDEARKRARTFRSIETRMRTFADVPYRHDDFQ